MDLDPAPVANPARDDPRSVDELLAAALGLDPEDHAYWDAVAALQWRDTPEVFHRAVALRRSPCPHERGVAAALLSQNLVLHNENRGARLAALRSMLAGEGDADVLNSILVALGHLKHPEGIEPALPFVDHADPDVRYGAIHALMGQDDERAIAGLIRLSRDPVAENRDWATFALGSISDLDTPDLRRALADRLLDEDPTTRGEALVGLARRGDARVLPVLRNRLAAGDVSTLELEAARELADPGLLPLLLALEPCADVSPSSLQDTISACTPPAPG